jgi:hypothetical protein
MKGQPTDEHLKKLWDLVKVEPLAAGMGALGEEMRRLDFRNDTLLVFEGGGQWDTILYKVVNQEIKLYDKDGNALEQDIVWKIERITQEELHLLFLEREDKQELVRLRYRTKG